MVFKMTSVVFAMFVITSRASSNAGMGKLSSPVFDLEGVKGSAPQSSKSTASEMEASLMKLLLGKTAFGATPMGGSVKKIHDILTTEMQPKVKDAHTSDQDELNRLMDELKKCFTVKKKSLRTAAPWEFKYTEQSANHRQCRDGDSVQFSSKESCLQQQRSLYQVKMLKCQYFAQISKKFGTTVNNAAIVTKAGGESIQSYIGRISGTICGHHAHGEKGKKLSTGGWGGGLADGFLDQYLKAKHACEVASKEYKYKVQECETKIHDYNSKKKTCNQFQVVMDSHSCKYAVMIKDTCEQYAGCYSSRLSSFQIVVEKVKMEERDRKAEWRGLTRMACLIAAFADGQISGKEVDECKKKVVNTDHFIIKYPKIPKKTDCETTALYPATGAYKRREFAPLPSLAKGQASVPCSGVEEIPTTPMEGSPKTCKCRRVTLEGHYRAGPLVKCTKCHDVSKSLDKSSCPKGTKIFAPATRGDWQTFLNSAEPLGDPHWIIDITRPQNGCGGCTSNAMNSRNKKQKSWRTSDKSPWWLRETEYSHPTGDYAANCYLGLPKKKPSDENSITFKDSRCDFHSKAYYCQKERIWVTPKTGSPDSCKCQPVTLASDYSAGSLVKCEQCISVSKAIEKNSCPVGMKIFSPRSRADWKTFIISAQPLRAPHWIIDITRPRNGCGGCAKYAMNSKVPNQATWKTSDDSAWWLRSTVYNQPSGDYTANCFMDLWRVPSSADTVQFNDKKCAYRSRSYYCQTKWKKPKKSKVVPAPEKAIRLVPASTLKPGLQEEVFYFNQSVKLPSFQGRSPNMVRAVSQVKYESTTGKWAGFIKAKDFAVRWSGFLIIDRTGMWKFKLESDEGSKLYIDNDDWINNDGIHAMQPKFGKGKLVLGQHHLRVEYFQKSGPSGIILWKKGPKELAYTHVTESQTKYAPVHGFKEEIYYQIKGSMTKIPNMNVKANVQRFVPSVNYKETKVNWKGFVKNDNFAVRWSGALHIEKGGPYKFSLNSDEGSRLFINKKLLVNNDGIHNMRNVEGTTTLDQAANIILEYFEQKGAAGMIFRYMGPDTESEMKLVTSKVMKARYARTKTPVKAKPSRGGKGQNQQ